jgi:hypothetical protein
MKHLLNNLSSDEKNRIREQYEGGMSIDTSKFKKLLETKLGDAKPLVNEDNSFGNWMSQGIGSATYDRDMGRVSDSLRDLEREKEEDRKNYWTPIYNTETGRGWTPESLSDYVLNKYGVEIPEEYMESTQSIREYLNSLPKQ